MPLSDMVDMTTFGRNHGSQIEERFVLRFAGVLKKATIVFSNDRKYPWMQVPIPNSWIKHSQVARHVYQTWPIKLRVLLKNLAQQDLY